MILTKLLKIAMHHVLLDRQKIYKIVLVKVFFFILWHFYFLGLVSKKLKNNFSEQFFPLKYVILGKKRENLC